MRLTIDIETDHLTDLDRRVLAALIGDDNSPLVLPQFDGPDVQKQGIPPAPPLPVPAPADFAARLGEAVQQFGPRGSGPEARLPFAQQAGVRTSSTMPDDDEDDAGAELETDLADRMSRAELGPNASRGDADMRVPDVDRPVVIRARRRLSVPRELVEDDVEPRRIEDVTRDAILGVVEQPPVRHTSP